MAHREDARGVTICPGHFEEIDLFGQTSSDRRMANQAPATGRRRTLFGRTWRKGVAKARGLSFVLEKCEDRCLVHPARRLGRAVRARC
ncbi:hypothetical protein PG991_014473 [Apiospora marii]|uniref:Uncharacterized protein n=2 Tax=Apiospora marii TaxID=335849 RepID=A0ABR1R3X6_9PEZI